MYVCGWLGHPESFLHQGVTSPSRGHPKSVARMMMPTGPLGSGGAGSCVTSENLHVLHDDIFCAHKEPSGGILHTHISASWPGERLAFHMTPDSDTSLFLISVNYSRDSSHHWVLESSQKVTKHRGLWWDPWNRFQGGQHCKEPSIGLVKTKLC